MNQGWYRYDPARKVLRLSLYIQPNASRSGFAGLYGQSLKVRIAAPAVDSRANALLLDFLAKSLAVPARKVMIKWGSRGRAKIVEIHDAGAELLERIGLLADQ
ncbi:MAG: DUF167 family protein [Burkholderiales bacterium]